MTLFDTEDGLILTQEGSDTRALAGRMNCLFVNRDKSGILKEYEHNTAFVRGHFRKTWRGDKYNLTSNDFNDLTQEITLDWMYVHIINREPGDISSADLYHPRTNDLVWEYAKRKLTEEEKIRDFCSQFLSLSREDFDKWLSGWLMYLEMK